MNGATDSMAPAAQLAGAGIRPVGRTSYELEDGSVHEYDFGLAQIEFMGEVTGGRVIFGPDDAPPLWALRPWSRWESRSIRRTVR